MAKQMANFTSPILCLSKQPVVQSFAWLVRLHIYAANCALELVLKWKQESIHKINVPFLMPNALALNSHWTDQSLPRVFKLHEHASQQHRLLQKYSTVTYQFIKCSHMLNNILEKYSAAIPNNCTNSCSTVTYQFIKCNNLCMLNKVQRRIALQFQIIVVKTMNYYHQN